MALAAARTSGGSRVSSVISESLLPALQPRKLQTWTWSSFSQLCCRMHRPGVTSSSVQCVRRCLQPRL